MCFKFLWNVRLVIVHSICGVMNLCRVYVVHVSFLRYVERMLCMSSVLECILSTF